MSNETKRVANLMGYDESILSEKIRQGYASVDASVEESLHTLTAHSVDDVRKATDALVHTLAGDDKTPEEREEIVSSILSVRLEQIKAQKKGKASKVGKLIKSLVTVLYLVGFQTAESIKFLLERRNWETVADRALDFLPVWFLISRLYQAGVRCKLADVRCTYRELFNDMSGDNAVTPKTAKHKISEAMFGFAIPDTFIKSLVTGDTKEVTVDNETIRIAVPSQLQKFEAAQRFDRDAQRNGIVSDTASQYKFNVAAIKEEIANFLQAEAEAKAQAEADKKAEADRIAQAEAAANAAMLDTQNRVAEIDHSDKLKAEAEAKAQAAQTQTLAADVAVNLVTAVAPKPRNTKPRIHSKAKEQAATV